MKTNPQTITQASTGSSLLAFCAVMLLAGCGQPSDPRTAPITAATPEEFTQWRTSVSEKIPPAEMQEFDSCVSEIRMGIMQRREASGVRPIEQKLCEYIDGKTMREVMITGCEATIEWVSKEIKLKRDNIKENAEMLKYPINDASREKILRHIKTVEENIKDTLDPKCEDAKKRLAKLQAEEDTKGAP